MSELTEQLEDLSPQQRDLLVLLLARKKREEPATRSPVAISRTSDHFPLSFAQQRLWFLNELQPDSAVYNLGGGVRMEGPLSVTALERALDEIVRRHESLRTTIRQIDSEPVQILNSPHKFSLSQIDLRDVPESAREGEAQSLLAHEARKPFNLEQGPLFRATLLLLSEREHILLLTMHHIVCDGWSIGIFVRELIELYESFTNNKSSSFPDLPVQYVDFAAWQRDWLHGKLLDKQISY